MNFVTDAVQRETSPRIMSTPVHAQRLLTVLINSGFEGKELIVSELQKLYAQVCQELNWQPRPWNPLANQFRLLTTGPHKVYRWFDFADGIRRRVRVFAIVRNPALQASNPIARAKQPEVRSAA
jgi:hypothetical protein